MAKIYSKKIIVTPKLNPKKETISFLLNFSKALTVFKTKNMVIETLSN